MQDSDKSIEQVIGYSFSDSALLQEAMIHPSIEVADRGLARFGYQRLEFLGDRVLGLIVADLVECAFPDEAEGALAKRHTALVRAEALALVAEKIGLGRFIRMSHGESAAGGRTNPAILSDICEALIGAMYRDGGIEAARAFIVPLWTPLLNQIERPPQDPKSALQEWAQGRGFALPYYRMANRSGPAHQPIFEIEVTVGDLQPIMGSGSSKRNAEKAAAEAALAQIKEKDDQ